MVSGKNVVFVNKENVLSHLKSQFEQPTRRIKTVIVVFIPVKTLIIELVVL